MNTPYRNAALLQLQSLLPGLAKATDQVHFSAGQALESAWADAHHIVLPEQGVLVLQQALGVRHVDVGLLGPANGLVVPAETHTPWQMRALCDGWAHVLKLPASSLSACGDLLLQWQVKLMQQVALWGYCRQHHPLPQRLATLLAVLRHDATQWDWQAWTGLLNVNASVLQAGLQALERVGAVDCQAQGVTIVLPEVLERQSCSCLDWLKPLATTV